MTILRERTSWRRVRTHRPSVKLTPEEKDNLRAALVVLRGRLGTWRKLAAAMGVPLDAMTRCNKKRRTITAAWALRASRLAGVPVESILAGTWLAPREACPMCGRT